MPFVGDLTSLALELKCSLERDFGTSFSIWSEQEEWEPISDFDFSEIQRVEADSLVSGVLKGHSIGPDATTFTIDDERQLLIVPVEDRPCGRFMVVGIVGPHESTLVRALANSVLQRTKQSHALDKAERQVADYIEQITETFEELAWLRMLSQHFELFDIRNDITHVSKSTLASLRQLINAQSLVLLGMPSSLDREVDLQAELPVLYWDGVRGVSEKAVHQLFATLTKDGLPRRPIVWNTPHYFSESCVDGLIRNYILTPIAKSNTQIGWLLAINRIHDAGSPADLDNPELDRNCFEFGTSEAGLLSSLAILLATHAKNLELLQEKDSLLIGVIRSLVNTIDAKDAYTGGHSDRVAMISKRIALQMGLPEAECEKVYMAGLLHDIGKIGVPDGVLGKTERLTDEETAIVRQHPAIGVEILKHLTPLRYVLPGVLHHHESLDGQGYPHGLAGEQIPMMSRIIAVADSYDAMVSDRTYRKGMATEKAVSILRQGAGTQWDGQVIDAFLIALPKIYSDIQTAAAQS
jgi:HD-GYP domain-containing protein (c-di-GMP phosphodiesterase class II)